MAGWADACLLQRIFHSASRFRDCFGLLLRIADVAIHPEFGENLFTQEFEESGLRDFLRIVRFEEPRIELVTEFGEAHGERPCL